MTINKSQEQSLANVGLLLQRLLLTHTVIETKINSGSNARNVTYIPRMRLIPSDKRILFKFNRRNFPIIVCFSMPMNKSLRRISYNCMFFNANE